MGKTEYATIRIRIPFSPEKRQKNQNWHALKVDYNRLPKMADN